MRFSRFTSLLPALFGVMVLRAQDPSAPVEAQVTEWVRLRTEIAAESADGREQSLALQREVELLQRERSALQAQVERLRAEDTSSRPVDSGRGALLGTQRAEAREWSAQVDASLQALREWPKRLPPGLSGELDDSIFAASSATDTPTRAAALAEGWRKLRTRSREFTVTSALVALPDGDTRRLDILYAGLSRAWAVSPDRSFAAIGVAGEAGWTWTPAPRHREVITSALDVVTRRAPPQLLDLPVPGLEGNP